MRLPFLILFGFLLLPCHGNLVDDIIDNIFPDSSCFSTEKGDLCQNNGTCVTDEAESLCHCVNGWSGVLCDECPEGFVNDEICNKCNAKTCLNGGICDISVDGIRCICEKGFYGGNCEYEAQTEDEIVATALEKVADSFKDTGLESFSIPPNAKIIVFQPSEPSTTLPTIPVPSEASTESPMTTIRANRPSSTETSVTETVPTTTNKTDLMEKEIAKILNLGVPLIRINFTIGDVPPSEFLAHLRIYSRVPFEAAFLVNGLTNTVIEESPSYNPYADVTLGSIIVTLLVDFTDCFNAGCRYSTPNKFVAFLNDPETSSMIGVKSMTATVLQKHTPTTNQLYSLWPILILITVVIILLVAIAIRRCMAPKDVHIRDEIPQYTAKASPGNRPIPIVDTTLHDALKYSKTPLESIPEVWTPLLNAVDVLGQTPLHAAVGAVAEKSEAAIISDLQLLNASESNINQRDFAGNTPLHIAIKCRRPEVVAYLLFLGADPNAYGPKKMTPLSMAIVADAFECFEKLLDHKKVDPNVAIEPEDTPLKMCIARGEANNKFFDALLRNPRTDVKAVGDIKTGIARAPIHVAVLTQNVYALNWLIKRNANLVAKDRAGKTPLLLAVEMESLEMAELLIPAMKTSDFYDANPECSPFEQAKLRNLREILDAMKDVELADIKPRKGGPQPRLSLASVKSASNSGHKPSPNMSIRRKVPPILPILSTISSATLNNSYQHASPSFSQQSMPMPLNDSRYCQSFLNSSNISNSPMTSTNLTANNYQQPSPLPSFGAYQQQRSPLTVYSNNYQQQQLPVNRYNNIMSPYQTPGTY